MLTTITAAPEVTKPIDRKHPPALRYLAFSEGCERFSYYGMQTLLVLYMADYLFVGNNSDRIIGFETFQRGIELIYGSLSPAAMASVTFGLYTGLVYLTPIVGGVIADRSLGRTRTITMGAILMVIGHFAMAMEPLFLFALLLLLTGTGCFKGNIASQLGSLYAPADPRRSRAFQIFYLGISAGAILAPLICGTLGETFGWHFGFAAAGIGMLFALVVYLIARGQLPSDRPVLQHEGQDAAQREKRPPIGRSSILPIFALLPILSLMAVPNQQIFNAYLLWGKANYDFQISGLTIPTSWLISLDAITTVIFLALSVAGWKLYARRFREPEDVTKLIFSGIVTMAAFGILAMLTTFFPKGGIHLGWAILFHAVNSLAFANMVPVGLSLFTRMAPASLGATAVGIYYLHLFIANNLVGWIGGYLERLLPMQFWTLHIVIAGAATVLLLVLSLLLRPTRGALKTIAC